MAKELETGMGMSRRTFSKTSLGVLGSWCFANEGLAHLPAMSKAARGKGDAVIHPYPEGDQGDLWLLGGQSNMFGNGRLLEEIEPDPRIQIYTHDNEWKVARDPLDFYLSSDFPYDKPRDYTSPPVHGSGLGLFFAKHVLQATNRPIGLIGIAWGKPMTMVWDPTLMDKGQIPPAIYHYGTMIQRVIDTGGFGKLKGMVWYQGESDAVEYPSASKVYEQQLLTFIDRVRKDTGSPNLPIIIVQIARQVSNHQPGTPGKAGEAVPGTADGPEEYDNLYETTTHAWEHVREIQRQLARKRENVYVVASLDLYPMVDPIHLDFAAYKRLGPRVGEVALSEVYKLPGHATPIELESIQMGPLHSYKTGQEVHGHTEIRVRLKGFTGKLQAPGQPSGFSVRFPNPGPSGIDSVAPIYAIDFDTKDPAVVLLRLAGQAAALKDRKAVLYYGPGLNPYCNIVDEMDTAVPGFGPIEL